MWSKRDAALIREMIDTLDRIARLVDGQEKRTFLDDQAKPHALAMFFVVLGEAANKVSDELKAAHPTVAWHRSAGLRNMIAHEYRRIDHDQLWTIAVEDLPIIRARLPEPPSPDAFD